jgi:hypothetical protein
MRPLAAILVCVVFIGVTALFTRERVTRGEALGPSQALIDERITLEIVPTFPLEADPFALKGEAEEAGPALTAGVNGVEVLRVGGPVEAGDSVRVSPVPGLAKGVNEVFVEGCPPSGRRGRVAGIRIRILRGEEILEEKVLWSDHSEKVSGTLTFTLRDSGSGKSDVQH